MIIWLKEIEIVNTWIGYMMKNQLEKDGIIKILPVFDNEDQAISVCWEWWYIIY